MFISGIATIFVCGKAELGFVLRSFISIANLGSLMLGGSALVKMGQLYWNTRLNIHFRSV